MGNNFRVLTFRTIGTAIAAVTFTVAAHGAPVVTGITNNYSFIPAGLSNSGAAPSSIITIFGSGMANAPPGPVALQSSAGPAGIPTNLNGASISVTVGGKTVTPAMYYATPTQIAAVLPAATPLGSGTLKVTYNGVAGNAFPIQVVPSAFGLDTYFGTGNGLVTATDAVSGALIGYTNSASPGQIVTLWGTGLGANPQDSDTVFTNTPHAVNQSSVQVYFGGVPGTVTYAGSSGYPGLDQIDVIVPDPIGCSVSLTVTVTGVPSNFPTIPVASGGGECSDPMYGIKGSDLNRLSGRTNVNSAALFVAQTESIDTSGTKTTISSATGDFRHYQSGYGTSSGLPSIGSCVVTEPLSAPTSSGIDAGTVSLSGSAGAYTLSTAAAGLYSAPLPGGAASPGGTFVFNWTGGSTVGAGSVTVHLPSPSFTWTNASASTTVKRSEGIQVSWTGGGSGSFVIISGTSSPPAGLATSFLCYARLSDLTFTVPSYVTEALPAGTGSLGLVDNSAYQRLSSPGLDSGAAWASIGTGLSRVRYQ